MMFTRSSIIALLAAPLLAFAANPNPFKVQPGFSASVGTPVTLSWTPTTSGTVSLILRSGNSNDLDAGTTIATNLPNSGSYNWTPSSSITYGTDYTVEIVDDADPSQMNYTPPFTLNSPNTSAASTSQQTLGAPTTSLSLSSASATPTMTTSTSASSSSSASTSSGASSTSSSKTSSSLTPAQSSQSAAAVPSPSSPTHNGATRATAVAGMLGVMALGALAL